VQLARRPDWPGYFGSPRLATAARGTQWSGCMKIQTDYALAILDGADERRAKRVGIDGRGDDPVGAGVERDALAYEAELERKRQTWLQAHPPK
jgi:hypothetical protein